LSARQDFYEGEAMKQLKLINMRKALALTVLGVVPTVVVGAALATPGLFITNTPIARGTSADQFKIKLQDSSSPGDAAIVQITQEPGGHSGWHAHPGPAVVIVKSGELTLDQAKGCSSATYTAGQVAIEPMEVVHRARNSGTGTLELWVTFLDVPVGASARIDAPDPGC
jgi:quercetin dioxygenase-like cupin family protein